MFRRSGDKTIYLVQTQEQFELYFYGCGDSSCMETNTTELLAQLNRELVILQSPRAAEYIRFVGRKDTVEQAITMCKAAINNPKV